MARSGRLTELIPKLEEVRPAISWPEVPDETKQTNLIPEQWESPPIPVTYLAVVVTVVSVFIIFGFINTATNIPEFIAMLRGFNNDTPTPFPISIISSASTIPPAPTQSSTPPITVTTTPTDTLGPPTLTSTSTSTDSPEHQNNTFTSVPTRTVALINTPTSKPTDSPAPPTKTATPLPTDTQIPPTATSTPVPTYTPTVTPSNTPIPTSTIEPTSTIIPSVTPTPMPSCAYGSRGWEFNVPGDTEGWKKGDPNGQLSNVSATGGNLIADIVGENSDPYFEEVPLLPSIDASVINVVYIRYRIFAPGQTMAQLFWTHSGPNPTDSEIGAGKHVDFGIVADGTWQMRSLNLSSHSLWDYMITAIRFDPVKVGNLGNTVEIDYIRLCSLTP